MRGTKNYKTNSTKYFGKNALAEKKGRTSGAHISLRGRCNLPSIALRALILIIVRIMRPLGGAWRVSRLAHLLFDQGCRACASGGNLFKFEIGVANS